MNVRYDPHVFHDQRTKRRKIAVVGSGISGLSAAWLLSQRHNVTIYEKEPWNGGHSNTVDVETADGPIAVDTGFIVYNEQNYPNLTALFDHLGVKTKPSDMSFSVSRDAGGFEYGVENINALVGQRPNIVRPRFWRLVKDIWRFYPEVRQVAGNPGHGATSLGAFLESRQYSAGLVNDHILPICAAIWSTTNDKIRELPLRTFLRFFSNHDLFNLIDRPLWRTVDGGSREYVKLLKAEVSGRVMTSNGARKIWRHDLGVTIEDDRGRHERFDEVVIATHANQALGLLRDPSPDETALLGAFGYVDNLAVLHSDPMLMPRCRRVWSSWNFISDRARARDGKICVTYWMNRLQNLDPKQSLFLTLNPPDGVDQSQVHATFRYSHPHFDQTALCAQESLWNLQGVRRTWFCGSYFGYGFHEDGLQAGLAVAEQLGGVRRPWQVADESGRISLGHDALEAAE